MFPPIGFSDSYIEGSVDWFQIFYYSLVKCRQFPVKLHRSVSWYLFVAFCSIRTGCIPHIRRFLLNNHTYSLWYDYDISGKISCRLDRSDSLIVPFEVNCRIRIPVIFLVFCLFLKHRELHILFHTVFFAIKIVIVRTITCIRRGIQWILPIDLTGFLHKWDKTFHVRDIGFCIDYCYVFITDGSPHVISRKQLIVSHVVTFHSHEGSIMIRFRVTVAVFPTDFYMLCIGFSLF